MMRAILILLALLAIVAPGCTNATLHAIALPAPVIEQPPANLPKSLHLRNWRGELGQGSCVHASMVNHLRWLNEYRLGERWRATYGDGEFDSRLRERLDAAGIDYAFTLKADPRFLDWASQTRRGAIIWWKPSHCCTFLGFVRDESGREYAAILDNNYPGTVELTPREQFMRLWAGFGGFALTVLKPPATSPPYPSYRIVQ